MSKSIEQLKREYNDSERVLSSKKDRISGLEQERSKLSQEQSDLERLSQIDQQVRHLQQEVSAFERTSAALKNQYDTLERELARIQSENQKTQKATANSKAEQDKYDKWFHDIDGILDELSAYSGQVIDTTKMVIKKLPKTLVQHSEAMRKSCEKKSKESFEEILKKLDSIDAVDSAGMTMLMYCLKHGFWYGVEKLLDQGADVNIVDANGRNALMYACSMPRMKHIIRILELTDAVNLQDANGNSAFYYLCMGLNCVFSSEKSEELREYDVSKQQIFLDSDLQITPEEGGRGINLGGLEFSLTSGSSGSSGEGAMISFGQSDGSSYAVMFSTKQINLRGSAIEYKINTIVDKFRLKGADMSAHCQEGLTPFFIACAVKNKTLVKHLLNTGVFSSEDNFKYVCTNGNGVLSWLAELRDIELIKYALNKGADINHRDNAGRTLINWMVMYGWEDIFDFLLAKGANPNIPRSDTLEAPIHLALSGGHSSIFSKLLSHPGVDIKARNVDGFSLVHYAVQFGNKESLERLISLSLDINSQSSNGSTPLLLACSQDKTDIAKFILTKKPEILADKVSNEYPLAVSMAKNNFPLFNDLLNYEKTDINYQSLTQKVTALWLACQDGKEQFVSALLAKGANPNIPRSDTLETPMHISLKKGHLNVFNKLINHPGIDINAKNADGQSILHYGAQLGNGDVVKLLIAKGIDINSVDKFDRSSVYLSAINGNSAMIEFLQGLGADINVLSRGFHPMHGAIHNGRTEVIDKLISLGVDVNIKSTSGYTPLQYYCELKGAKVAVVQHLVSKGASISCVRGDNAVTLVHSAVIGGNQEILDYLFNQAMDVDAVLAVGHTALLTACEMNDIEMVKFLVSKGANVNKVANKGETAIQYACGYGSVELVKYLQSAGAKIEQKSQMDCDGVHEAFWTSNLAVIDYLYEQEFDFNYRSSVEHKTPVIYLLENKAIPSEKKLAVLKKYIGRVDLTLADNDGNGVIYYAHKFCPEAVGVLVAGGVVDDFVNNSNPTLPLPSAPPDDISLSGDAGDDNP